MAWAEGQWAEDRVEEAGAVYNQDEMMSEFCACVDPHCPGPDFDDNHIFMCVECELDDEVDVEVGVDVDGDSNMFESVCGIDDAENDEFVALITNA